MDVSPVRPKVMAQVRWNGEVFVGCVLRCGELTIMHQKDAITEGLPVASQASGIALREKIHMVASVGAVPIREAGCDPVHSVLKVGCDAIQSFWLFHKVASGVYWNVEEVSLFRIKSAHWTVQQKVM